MGTTNNLVTYHVNTLKHDIKELRLSENEVATTLGKSHSYISQTVARRQIDYMFIRDFCEKYFSNTPDQWKRYVVADDHKKYKSFVEGDILTVRKKQSLNTVKPDFEKIEELAASMRLTMTSVCKIFGYGESYFFCAKNRGLIATEFLDKFAELTSKEVSDFIIPEPEPESEEKPQTPEIDLTEIVEKLNDIDAAVVGVMKLLQSNNAKFDVLIGEVKKHYD
jgi:hypothetical protein